MIGRWVVALVLTPATLARTFVGSAVQVRLAFTSLACQRRGVLEAATLAILAGGRGERLGRTPKGLLRYRDEPLLARLLRLADRFADVLLVTDDPASYAAFDVRRVGDRLPGHGAPGGVLSALVAATTDHVFVVACDMPFVTVAALEQLDRHAGPASLVCFEVAGRLEPLLGRYARALAPAWEGLLVRQPSFRELFAALGGHPLPEALLREVDPEASAVVSLNTPADLQRWRVEPGSGSKPARHSSGG